MIKDVVGYEGLYTCDEYGNVFSCATNTNSNKHKKLMKQNIRNGYYYITLTDIDGKRSKKYVHRIIAQAFIDNPNDKKEVNHIDCNKLNNNIMNLEWSTRKENLQHSYDNGLKREHEKHGMAKLTKNEVLQIRKLYKSKEYSYSQLSKMYNVSMSCISMIVTNRNWRNLKGGD